MTAPGPGSGAAVWAERYETLRGYVLEGRQRLQCQPLGLALWVAKGMAGWMGQWSQLVAPTWTSAPPAPRWHLASAGLGPDPLTRLLAQITLQHRFC
jgi:hypothetical protein